MPFISATNDIFSSSYTCASGVAVGDPVYISAANTVAKCDSSNAAKMPCIGIVFSKPTTTSCIVQEAGECTVLTGLTADTMYYVSAAGTLVSSTAGLVIIQQIGEARSTTNLVMTSSTSLSTTNLALSGTLSVTGTSTLTGLVTTVAGVTVGTDLIVGGTSALNDTVTILDGKNIIASAAVTGNVLGGASDKWAFFGGAPVVVPVNTTDARHALVLLGLIASGGNGITQRLRPPLSSGLNSDYTVLTATPAAGKFGLAGTVGTATNLVGEAAQNNTKTSIVLYEAVLPTDYIAAQNITVTPNIQRVVAGGTTLTTTLDCEVWVISDAGVAGSDLCATTIITYTATVATDEPFTITGTTLNPGDRLLIRLTAAATEADNAGTVTTQLNSVRIS